MLAQKHVRDVSLTAVWQPAERNSANMTLNSEVDRYNDLTEIRVFTEQR